jgi:peptide deformylase
MPVRSLVAYRENSLRAIARSAEPASREVREAAEDLRDTLATQRGVAMAAPQIGIPLRLFVWDLKRPRDPGGPPARGVLVNPEILERTGSVPVVEGCLSFPGLDLSIRRPERVTVAGFDLRGSRVVYTGSGLFARMVEHEVDHLEGILLPDRQPPLSRLLSLWRRRRWEKRWEKLP